MDAQTWSSPNTRRRDYLGANEARGRQWEGVSRHPEAVDPGARRRAVAAGCLVGATALLGGEALLRLAELALRHLV